MSRILASPCGLQGTIGSENRRQDHERRAIMYGRILVPVDGSTFSEEVIPYARGVAKTLGATLTLLCVAENDAKVAEAEEYVQVLAAKVDAEGRAVASRGDVSDDILEEAGRVPGTLTAITSRGRGGLLVAMLGSVARELVQSSHTPVLVYRPHGKSDGDEEPSRITTVLLPLDGSSRSESMQTEAAQWAIALKADLVIVQVLPENQGVDQLLAEYDVLDDSYVRAHARDVKREFGINASWDVLYGHPVASIARYLDGRRDVLVVIATREQPALQAAVLGSVTSGLLHQVGVPMVVQAPIDAPPESVIRQRTKNGADMHASRR
jgi:nucleotide-binding universal stress UspA family protein